MKKILGKIVRGKGRGKRLGFPTANVSFNAKVPVEQGIYACWVIVRGKRFAAATSVGVNAMFDEKEPTIEAHLFDFSGDIYGENVEIAFVKRLRGMEKFANVELLKKQIQRDVEEVRRIFRSASAASLSLSSAARRAASGIRPRSVRLRSDNRARSGS